jgi:MFS transporter, YNFM family, putative membrane transport protein
MHLQRPIAGESFLVHDYGLQQGRFKTIAIALAGFSAFLQLYATQSLLPLLTQVFQASKVEVSLTVSATTLAVCLAAPFVGLMADRLGRKPLIALAALGLSIPTLLAATATSLPILIFWRFIQGLFIPAIFAATVAYISEEWPQQDVGRIMAAYITGNILGGVAGRLLSGLMADQLGWQAPFILLGCLNLLTGVVIGIGLPPSRNFKRSSRLKELLIQAKQTCFTRSLLPAYGVGFNILFANVSVFTYVNFYLADAPFHLNTQALGFIFLVYLWGAIATPIVGRRMARLGYPTTLAIAIGIACAGVLLTLCKSLGIIILGLSLCAMGIFVCQSVANSYVGAAAGQAKASAAGLYVAFYYLGGSVGAILPGFAWHLGGWPACVACIVVAQVLTGGLALAFWRDNEIGQGAISSVGNVTDCRGVKS